MNHLRKSNIFVRLSLETSYYLNASKIFKLIKFINLTSKKKEYNRSNETNLQSTGFMNSGFEFVMEQDLNDFLNKFLIVKTNRKSVNQ